MRFDAYAGNVWGGTPGSEVAEVLALACHARVSRARPMGRYTDRFELEGLSEEGSAWLGRDEQQETVYFEVKGATTPRAVEAIRKHWGDKHSVSRCDAGDGFDSPGVYGQLVRLVDQAISDPRVKSKEIRPRNDETAGATTYWGSPQSRVMVRCYEAGKMKERLHHGRPHWARLENQCRPGKAAEKRLVATLSPLETFGLAAWSKRAAEALTGVELERFAPEADAPQFDKTTRYLARGFRRHFVELLERHASWQNVGELLEQVWTEDDKAKEALARLVNRRKP